MDKIACYSAFARAAETKSFVAAGRLLGITPSAVGKNVARLEAHLNVRLLQRSTRRIALTNEGTQFYRRCREILADIDAAENTLTNALETPKGTLRISVIVMGYRFLMPILAEFAHCYPEIKLDLDFDDRVVDVIGENLDAVIRSGKLSDSRLMARRIGSFKSMLYAAPAYLKRNGIPRRVEDLHLHACIRFRNHTSGKLQPWRILDRVAGREAGDETAIPATLICNNIEAMLAATISGLGISYMPSFIAREAADSGSLTPVLDLGSSEHDDIHIVWPASPNMPPRLRAFLDFVASRLFIE